MGAVCSSPPPTAPNLDIARYTGFDTPDKQRLWYCVYALPQIWMPETHHTVRALYKWDPDAQEMRLRNTSMNSRNVKRQIFGSAWVNPNYQTNSKLLVEFDFSSYIPLLGNLVPNLIPAHYWILMVADDYRYAVVSAPCRTSLFLLSSTPNLDVDDLEYILQKLVEVHGFTRHQLHRLHKYELPTEPAEQAELEFTDF